MVHVVATALMGTVSVDDKPRKGGLLAGRVGSGAAPPVAGSTAVQPATLGLGLFQVVTADDGAAVFGSRVVPVGGDRAEVGVLFGSTTVVVPDDARVRTTGFTVFGSVECASACSTAGDVLVEVGSTGAFGSVEILTESERAAEGDD